jgi:hypothetical protein
MIYAEALKLLEATPDDTAKSELWTNNGNGIADARSRFSDGPAFIDWLTSVDCFTAPHPASDGDQLKTIDNWLAILKDVPVEESPYATPSGIVMRDGKRLSTQLLLHTYYAGRIDTVKPMAILEIGAGFGGLARILNSKMQRQYTILDLPGSLFCSYVYLKTHFPDRTFKWCHTAADFGTSADFHFVPARLWKDLMGYSFDMAINTCSMGEMLPETVADYLSLIKETCSYFYSHNRTGSVAMAGEILIDETGAGQTDPLMPPSRELLVRI